MSTQGTPRLFWPALGVGWAMIVFGLWTLLSENGSDNTTYSLGLTIALNVLHDAIVAPLVCIAGFVVTRLVPALVRRQVAWGLGTSAVLVAIAYVPWRGDGLKPDNPSFLPLDYTVSILTVLAVVWAMVVVWSCLALARHNKTK